MTASAHPDNLGEFVDGQLDGIELAVVRDHVSGCADCTRTCADYIAIIGRLADPGPVTVLDLAAMLRAAGNINEDLFSVAAAGKLKDAYFLLAETGKVILALREALGQLVPPTGTSSEGAREHLKKLDAILITITERCLRFPTVGGIKP